MEETGKNLCPYKDGLDNLGKSDKEWGNTYTKTLNVSNTANIKQLAVNGDITATGDITGARVFNAVYNDYAELFEKGEETEPGDIIALDSTSDTERYVKATKSSKVLVGVHSGEFAQIIGGKEKSLEENLQSHIPVGLAGRVYVKVEGDVHPGDNIGPGNTPGIGVKTTSGPIVGIALTEPQDGKVRILIRIGEITC